MKVLASALFFALALSVGAPSADAGNSDASAIASFLSIGLANAPSNFSAIRCEQKEATEDGEIRCEVTSPDRAHFSSCESDRISHLAYYDCDSTLRTTDLATLFAMTERIVRANLPSGYTSPGEQHNLRHHLDQPYEEWTLAGSPDVQLFVYAKDGGKVSYRVQMTTH